MALLTMKPAGASCAQKGEDAPMTMMFRKGMRVRWNWGQGVGRGRIAERFEGRVEREIDGAPVRRNGSRSDPAFLIRADSGGEVLKLGSELSAA